MARWWPLPILLALALLASCAASAVELFRERPRPTTEQSEVNVGFTFSRRQAEYLGLPWHETFRATAVLSPNVVRLGAYWDDIERRPGEYDFSTLDWLIDSSAQRNLKVVLTVGMKAPRWPEYFLPTWLERDLKLPDRARISDDPLLRAKTLEFVTRVVERYRDRPAVEYWQVENEPLDPSGRHSWHIGADFVAEEIALVRRLDVRRRPILVSMFVDSSPLSRLPPWRDEVDARARTILLMADVLGVDVYTNRGVRVLGRDFYMDWSRTGWEERVIELQQIAQSAGKQAWVLEAQAEPWEPARVVHTDSSASRSLAPSTGASIFERLRAAGFRTILFWGVEHWYMRLQHHADSSWWELLGAFFHQSELLNGKGSSLTRAPAASRDAYWLRR